MLTHFPSFPLIIFRIDKNHDLTPEDERGIMFALKHRDRVRRIYLSMPVLSLEKVIKTLEDQFPVLESLYILPVTMHDAHLVLPATFSAPQLSYLTLNHFAFPTGSPSPTTAVSLVRLSLRWVYPSINLYPNHLLKTLSLLPQLQDFSITFSSPVLSRDIERHMLHMPNISYTTHPSLRSLVFGGTSAYFEALLSHMNPPLLGTLGVTFFNQLNFFVPHLRQFVTTTENLKSSSVTLLFYHRGVSMFMYPPVTPPSPTLNIRVGCDHLDWQVFSMTQILSVLGPIFSAVVDLTLDYRGHILSSEWHNQADSTHWRELLGPFRNVRILRVHNDIVGEVSRCLALDGELASGILPELKILVCPMGSRDDKMFATLIHDREVAGLPIDHVEVAFPARRVRYEFGTPTGIDYIPLP